MLLTLRNRAALGWLALMLAACDGNPDAAPRAAAQLNPPPAYGAESANPNLAAPADASAEMASADPAFAKSFSVEMNRQQAERRTHGESAEPVQQPYVPR